MTGRAGGEEQPRHLVAVWNPSYTTDAMEEHLRVLLSLAARYDGQGRTSSSLYGTCRRVPMSRRKQPSTVSCELAGDKRCAAAAMVHAGIGDWAIAEMCW